MLAVGASEIKFDLYKITESHFRSSYVTVSQSFMGFTHTHTHTHKQALVLPILKTWRPHWSLFFLLLRGFQKRTPHQEEDASRECVLIHWWDRACFARPTGKSHPNSTGKNWQAWGQSQNLISLRACVASSLQNKPLWEPVAMMVMMKFMVMGMSLAMWNLAKLDCQW